MIVKDGFSSMSSQEVVQHTPSMAPGVADFGIQYAWASILVEELVRLGTEMFVLAPGSRNTPLTLAVAANPLAKGLLHYDERGGAFAALGFARATGKPSVWITTSGTAVANGLPAIIEADVSGVPLIMITADRPPELRDTGANQTITQPGMFGQFVRWQCDMPVPDLAIEPAYVLTTIDQAFYRSMHPAGPVHLNCMFRKPFLVEQEGGVQDWVDMLDVRQRRKIPYTGYGSSERSITRTEIATLAIQIEGVERGLVIAGQLDSSDDSKGVVRLAETLGWPLLTDVTSNCGNTSDVIVKGHELLLCSDAVQELYKPVIVLHLGGSTVSSRLQRFIAQSTPEIYAIVHPAPDRIDPSHIVSHRFQASAGEFCTMLAAELVPSVASTEWLTHWKSLSTRVHDVIESKFLSEDLSEPAVALSIGREIPDHHGLVLASSMPVRDVNMFANPQPSVRVASNRGASGIDGTIATAAGFAHGIEHPVTLLIGDLAFLHDLNSLALLGEGPPVTVVVINNDGGGIFHFLPIEQQSASFEKYFCTPHGIQFRHAAELFGLDYARPESLTEFIEMYRHAVSSGSSSVIEVSTNRKQNAELHRAIWSRSIQVVEQVLGL